jgi:hypothetical protein
MPDEATSPTDPEPRKKRRRGTPPSNWKEIAADVMAKTRNVTTACKRAGVDRSTYYAHLENDPAFRKTIDEATTASVDRLEGAAYRLALAGSERQQQFLLKAWRPEIYNVPSRVHLGGPDGGPIEIDVASELNAALDRIQARTEPPSGTPVDPGPDDAVPGDPGPTP